MRRKGRSAGYLFCGARLVPDAQRCTAGGVLSTFVCLCAEWGRFFRLGWVRGIVADARVPQLASFRLLRFW